MLSFRDALDAVAPRPPDDASRAEKKNYAQFLSEAIAVLVANELRAAFPEILPSEDGTGLESRARTGKGIKRLDVNYSTPELGLGMGISIKTLNFKDPRSQRYTKNPTRLDNELRAEAIDYHQRQPYAVLVGLVFVPVDSCDDGDPARPRQSRSSFAQIVNVLRHRSGRSVPEGDPQLLERLYVGLYDQDGGVYFFDVKSRPPQFGQPAIRDQLNYRHLLHDIVQFYDSVNTVLPAWEEVPPEGIVSLRELEEAEALPEDEEDDEDDGEVF